MELHPSKVILVAFSILASVALHVVDATAAHSASIFYSNPTGLSYIFPLANYQATSYSPENSMNADSVIIPVKRAGRLLLIEATVDNETGNFIFDTGANKLIFNGTYFRNHIRTQGESSSGINGSIGTVEQTTIDKIEFAGLIYKKVKVDLANLGHIENRRGVKILGLIGFNLMKDFEILIDTKNNQLKLYRLNKAGERVSSQSAGFKPDYSQKIWMISNILFLEGKIGGKKLNFCFDTGAETNVISSFSNKNVLSSVAITRRSGLRGAGSNGTEVLFGRMDDFSLGNKQINGMETIISNLESLSEVYGTRIDGMLGFNFMEQGILCINFVKKQFGIQFTKGEEK